MWECVMCVCVCVCAAGRLTAERSYPADRGGHELGAGVGGRSGELCLLHCQRQTQSLQTHWRPVQVAGVGTDWGWLWLIHYPMNIIR